VWWNIFSCDDPRAVYQTPGSPLGFVSSATGIAGFALAVFACQLRTGDSDVAPSNLATFVLLLGTPRCSNASADEPVEIAARILSANKPDGAGVGRAFSRRSCGGQVDFSRQLDDLH
jgi:hypothetical protein